MEKVKKSGDVAIKRWINDNMQNRSCVIVLIGEETYKRPWVRYEIEKAWNDGRGLVGIYIHNIKDPLLVKLGLSGKCNKGLNPFSQIFSEDGKRLSDYVKCYDPNSFDAYNDIANNLEKWIEDAINIRSNV